MVTSDADGCEMVSTACLAKGFELFSTNAGGTTRHGRNSKFAGCPRHPMQQHHTFRAIHNLEILTKSSGMAFIRGTVTATSYGVHQIIKKQPPSSISFMAGASTMLYISREHILSFRIQGTCFRLKLLIIDESMARRVQAYEFGCRKWIISVVMPQATNKAGSGTFPLPLPVADVNARANENPAYTFTPLTFLQRGQSPVTGKRI